MVHTGMLVERQLKSRRTILTPQNPKQLNKNYKEQDELTRKLRIQRKRPKKIEAI